MTASPSSPVITGVGLFSPLGIGQEVLWENLAAMQSGIGPTDLMQGTSLNVGGEVPGFDDKTAKKEYLNRQKKNVKVMCREIQLGVASALQAMDDAGLSEDDSIARERIGIDFGANLMLSPPDVLADPALTCTDDAQAFHFERWGGEDGGLQRMSPLWLLMYLPNMPACHIAITVDARGPSNSLTLDEASGGAVIGEAVRILERGQADVMIAGTTGTRLHPVKSVHAAMWDEVVREHADPPETWMRPFDSNRLGQVVGEGSATLILENESHAKARGATIYGSVLGTGSSCVIDRVGKPNDTAALVNAMRAALADADLSADQIGHISANGLATLADDRAEAEAICTVFGSETDVPVTAFKSYVGNSGSGCGPLELAASLIAVRHGVVPATRNVTTPDPECGLNVVHGEHLKTDNKVFLSINVTRMGQASAVVVAAN